MKDVAISIVIVVGCWFLTGPYSPQTEQEYLEKWGPPLKRTEYRGDIILTYPDLATGRTTDYFVTH